MPSFKTEVALAREPVTVTLDVRTARRVLLACEHLASLYLPVYQAVAQAERRASAAAASTEEVAA